MCKMKTIGYIAGFMGVMAIAAGCAKEQESVAPTPVTVEEPASSAVPGMIRLKVNADLRKNCLPPLMRMAKSVQKRLPR